MKTIHPLLSVLVWGLVLGSGAALFKIGQDVQRYQRAIETTKSSIEILDEQSNALRLEWAALNNPERLATLLSKIEKGDSHQEANKYYISSAELVANQQQKQNIQKENAQNLKNILAIKPVNFTSAAGDYP